MPDELPADDDHHRPVPERGHGVSDELVAAVGKLSEALEWVERARGRLYDFHQMMGRADLTLGEAAEALRQAGAGAQADAIERDLVGRNVLSGRWTFQIVEEFDDGYWTAFRSAERRARDELVGGRRHIFESEMKEDRRTHGRPHHEARPSEGGSTGAHEAHHRDQPP